MERIAKGAIIFSQLIGLATAQVPAGSIAGVVHDASGVAVAGALVKATSLATGLARTAITPERSDYSFPTLMPGDYEVTVEASGFRRAVRRATVEAGVTTATDFALIVGDVKESITVDGAMPQMHYDSHAVGGLVTQEQIENLPLNGRRVSRRGVAFLLQGFRRAGYRGSGRGADTPDALTA